jgi:hypothetical protein
MRTPIEVDIEASCEAYGNSHSPRMMAQDDADGSMCEARFALTETVTAFFEDMKRRELNDPLLVTSDGAPGIIKAIEICLEAT